MPVRGISGRHPPGAAQARLEEHIMLVKFAPNDRGNPPGKLADAEVHFCEGTLDGLKLMGFGVWERKNGNGRNVTFPAPRDTNPGTWSTLTAFATAQTVTIAHR
jgi:hypothetical protein